MDAQIGYFQGLVTRTCAAIKLGLPGPVIGCLYPVHVRHQKGVLCCPVEFLVLMFWGLFILIFMVPVSLNIPSNNVEGKNNKELIKIKARYQFFRLGGTSYFNHFDSFLIIMFLMHIFSRKRMC